MEELVNVEATLGIHRNERQSDPRQTSMRTGLAARADPGSKSLVPFLIIFICSRLADTFQAIWHGRGQRSYCFPNSLVEFVCMLVAISTRNFMAWHEHGWQLEPQHYIPHQQSHSQEVDTRRKLRASDLSGMTSASQESQAIWISAWHRSYDVTMWGINMRWPNTTSLAAAVSLRPPPPLSPSQLICPDSKLLSPALPPPPLLATTHLRGMVHVCMHALGLHLSSLSLGKAPILRCLRPVKKGNR